MQRIFIFCFLISLTVLAEAQNQAKAFDSVFTYLYNNDQFNGNVLVADKGRIIFKRSYGYADLLTNRKLDDRSMFELASVSKQFTAIAILQLMEKGALTLDDSLSKYFPELPYQGITIRHLLTHTSGIPDYMPLFEIHWDSNRIANNNDMIGLLARYHSPSLFNPGDKYEYSNTGYALLAAIIEKVSGESYAAFLQQNIFRPLKMRRTRVYNTRRSGEKIRNYAYGYVFNEKTGKYVLPDSLAGTRFVFYLDGITGDGTVNSTTIDLLKWDRALYTDKLVSHKTLKEAFTPYMLKDGKATNYGYGWELINDSTAGAGVWHNGGWPGYYTAIYRFIDKDKTLILLRNARKPAKLRLFQEALLDILFNRRLSMPVIEK